MIRDPNITSKIMASIKSTDTKPEMLLRRALWNRNYRYQVHYKKIPGRPDIALTKAKIAIFCDGDFWHGNNWKLRGLSSFEEELNQYDDYWKRKLLDNVERDERNNLLLTEEGWLVLRFWASDIQRDLPNCIRIIEEAYQARVKFTSCFEPKI